MRRIAVCCLASLACLGAAGAWGQGYPGARPGGMGGGPQNIGAPDMSSIPSEPSVDKPDAAASKAYKAAIKALTKAHEHELAMAKAADPDKRADELDKAGDAYGKALDYFTAAIMNKGDMVDAWNGAGYVHLRLGAYNESIDDYNHTLALKPELYDAIEHRAEAYMATDHLEDAKASYMDLFNHARPLADQLMVTMQKWLQSHRAAANGMRASDIDSFDKWLQEQDGIARQTASAAAPAKP